MTNQLFIEGHYTSSAAKRTNMSRPHVYRFLGLSRRYTVCFYVFKQKHKFWILSLDSQKTVNFHSELPVWPFIKWHMCEPQNSLASIATEEIFLIGGVPLVQIEPLDYQTISQDFFLVRISWKVAKSSRKQLKNMDQKRWQQLFKTKKIKTLLAAIINA